MALSVNANQKQMSKKWLLIFVGLFCLTFLNYVFARMSLLPPRENQATAFWLAIIYDRLLKLSLFALLSSWVLIVAYPIVHRRWSEAAVIVAITFIVNCSFFWLSTIFPTLSIADTTQINAQTYYLIEVPEPWEFWTNLGFCVGQGTNVSCDYFFTIYETPPEHPKLVTRPDGTVEVQWNKQTIFRYKGSIGSCYDPNSTNITSSEFSGYCSSYSGQ